MRDGRPRADQLTGGSDGEDLTNDAAVNVGEAVVAAGVSIRQSRVVKAHHVQYGRVQVVNVDLVLHGMPAKFVGGPVNVSAPHTAAGHPHGEPEGVVLAPVGPLGGRSAAEFSTPEDEGIVE